MELYREAVAFLIVFFLFVILFFIYTEFSVNRKQIRITNAAGKNITVNVEIADDPLKMSRGLMFRQSLGEYDGMLFVFNSSGRHGFWMVNTTIALDAVFFDGNKTAVDVIRMEPCSLLQCKIYTPKKDAKYVLEVNAGFAEKHNITEGCRFYDG